VLPRGGKFEPRAKKSVVLGFSTTQKGYKLYDLDQQSVFVSRDVVFKERVFPLKDLQSHNDDPHPLFLPFSHNADEAPTQDLYLNATCKHQTYALLLNLLHMSQHQVQTLL